jgi:hypothetical protein
VLFAIASSIRRRGTNPKKIRTVRCQYHASDNIIAESKLSSKRLDLTGIGDEGSIIAFFNEKYFKSV